MLRLLRVLAVITLAMAGVSIAASPAGAHVTISYEVGTYGSVSTDVDGFAAHVGSTLDDTDGWSLGGSIDFVPVSSDGSLEILIAEPAAIGAIQGCSSQYSCHVSGTVYINEDRWDHGAAGWSESLDAYRHYVVNHEVGHYLGLGHWSCPGSGAEAPVMMQQTIETDPCVNRVWPLPAEREAVADRYGVEVRDASEESLRFVETLYQRVLARSPSDHDAEALAQRLDRGEVGQAEAATAMFASHEFDVVTAAVGRLYYAAFLRAPDPGGALHWAGAVQDGYGITQVAEDFAGSAEFRARYGDLDHGEFVEQLYQNALGRPSDPDGHEYWTSALESGELTRGEVLHHFAQSNEHRMRRGVDVDVALYYVCLLDRRGDPEGVAYWTEEIEDGTPRVDVVWNFLSSSESVL